jgi:hypothetical protein
LPETVVTPAATLIGAVFLLGALAVYGAQVDRIVREGGKVRTVLGFPELLVSYVLAMFFTWATAAAILHHGGKEPEANINSVLPSSLVFLIFTVGVAAFVRYRGLRLRSAFGFDRVPFFAVIGWACGLILAAFPIALAVNILTALSLKDKAEPQALVDLFNKVVRLHDYAAIGKILLSAVIIQPVCEEFIFRGFFYGTWKRYLGPLGSGLLTCLLFAACHVSLGAFAGLFVLAVCLNIAYERTGSLLVPMLMHALFNFTSLLFICVQVHFAAPPP